MPSEVVLVLGFANLMADGMSMGIGDYLSERSELDFIQSERAREEWEFTNFREGEIAEMMEIYTEKGLTAEDAAVILNTMAKYPRFFIDHMVCSLSNAVRCDDGENVCARAGPIRWFRNYCCSRRRAMNSRSKGVWSPCARSSCLGRSRCCPMPCYRA